jgi:hypothetical protein
MAKSQVSICDLALELLVEIVNSPGTNEETRDLIVAILNNISRHPSNRTKLYITELASKSLQAKSRYDKNYHSYIPMVKPHRGDDALHEGGA